MASKSYDAIVIGSGITGGWAAKELTEKGLETLVLEAGRPIDPATDYVEHVPVWQTRFRGLGNRNADDKNQPIQQKCSALDELSSKFFVNDNENPYITEPDKPFLWIRGRQVGGRSIMWGRQSYRWSDLDFEANAREGIAMFLGHGSEQHVYWVERTGKAAQLLSLNGAPIDIAPVLERMLFRDSCSNFPMENFCRPWK